MDLIDAIRSLEGRDCIALEKIDDQDAVIHLIRNPNPTEKDFYRSGISRTYFHERDLNKWHDKYYTKGLVCPRWFDMKTSFDSRNLEREVKFFDELPDEARHPIRDLPIVEHQSVWDFYSYVKYDYKKKKWL